MMSVSGEEVAECRLEGCQLVLRSSPLGLSLNWLTTKEGKKKLLATSCLTNVKCGGSLYPVLMDPATEESLFGNIQPARKCSASKSGPLVALVVSGNRTVMAAHCKMPGLCVRICRMVQPVLWTGTLTVDHKSVIVVVSKGITVSLGRNRYLPHHIPTRLEVPHHDRFLWSTRSLPAAPVTCCGRQNMLLVSDGAVCWLCWVSISERDDIVLRSNKLCISGIIRITDEEKIQMFTCDGRKYICSWDNFSEKNEAECKKQCVKVSDTVQLHTISDIMKAIANCSKIINFEGKTIQTLVLYIKQLRLAQILLAEQKCVFFPSVRVEKSMENKDYLAIVQLHKTEAGVCLRGRWWALCMVINGVTGKSVSTMKLKDEQLRSDIYEMMLVLPPLDFSTTSGHLEIQIYLVLECFSSAQPVCKVLACQAQVDILNFLVPECNLSTNSSKWDFGTTKIIHASKTSSRSKDQRKDLLPFCKISLSFVNSSRTRELMCRLFNFTVSKNNETKKSYEVTLWYRDNRIDVECVEENEKIILKLKSSNSYVVLSLKAALERRVKELKQCVTTVTLPSSVFREAHFTCRLFNNEENHAARVTTVSHLYHAIVMLSSLIPLQ